MGAPQQPGAEGQHGADAQRQNHADGTVGVHRQSGSAALRNWALLVGWVAVIASFSSERFSDVQTAAWLARAPFLTGVNLSPALLDAANLILRKSMHFVEYAILAALAYRAMGSGAARRSRRQRVLGAVLLGVGVATVDELHQAFTLTRTGRVHDVVLDAAGVLSGALLAARADVRARCRRHGAGPASTRDARPRS